MLSRDEPEALFVVNALVTELLGAARKKEGEGLRLLHPGRVGGHGAELHLPPRGARHHDPEPGLTRPSRCWKGHLIVFAELKEQAYTGIGISCGGGTFNVCVSYKGVPALTFLDAARGGDWIDEKRGRSPRHGRPPWSPRSRKGGMDLLRPRGRVEEAVAIYYRHLLQYTLEMFPREARRRGRAAQLRGSR